MKKLITLFTIVLFVLCSCSVFTPQDSASFTFGFDKEFATMFSRSVIWAEFDEAAQVKIVATLSGGVNDKKEVTVSFPDFSKDGVSIKFSKVPLNKTFDINVQGFLYGDELFFEGNSKGNTVKGKDTVTVEISTLFNTNYVLFRTDNDYFTLDVFTPSKLSTADNNSVQDPVPGESTAFLDYAFDKSGNLWAINGRFDDISSNFSSTVLVVRALTENLKTGEKEYQYIEKNIGDIKPVKIAVDMQNNRLIVGCVQNLYDSSEKLVLKVFSIDDLLKAQSENSPYVPIETHSTVLNQNYVTCIEANGNICYLAGEMDGPTAIMCYNFMTNDGSIITYLEPEWDPKAEELEGLEITDMLYQDGKLYALVSASPRYETVDTECSFTINSRGAVIELDPQTLAITRGPIGLASMGKPINTQFPAVYSGCLIYSDSEYKTVAKIDGKITFNAPQQKDANLFFGPKKFIAIKPKKLVVADSGIFCYQEDDLWLYNSGSRIVTVDLENFAISGIKNTKIDFTEPISNGSKYSASVTGYYANNSYLNNGTENVCVYKWNSFSSDIYVAIDLYSDTYKPYAYNPNGIPLD